MDLSELVRQAFLQPWYRSLEDPAGAQATVLRELLQGYGKTHYGREHDVARVSNMDEYRSALPPVSYNDLKSLYDRVREGEYGSILPEAPESWVMTRGSTGVPKVIPITQTHIRQVRTCGARALLNFSVRTPGSSVLRGKVLNLNFPSEVDTTTIGEREVGYGYSSGTYARLIPRLYGASLVPGQADIDELGPGIAKSDWRARFEMVYQKSRSEDVKSVMGVAPVLLAFARYVGKAHHLRPRDMWQMDALFATSVPKIQSNYAPRLRRLYGDVPVVEMYTATEGVFGQQLDDLPYFCPNFDAYLFEVRTGSDLRMLHDMSRGEWGRLIISSCLFPRYEIGDLIECMGGNYFRVFGRDSARVLVEHRLYRLLTRWFI